MVSKTPTIRQRLSAMGGSMAGRTKRPGGHHGCCPTHSRGLPAGHAVKIGHAELEIGDSVVMLADASPDMGHEGPRSLGGSPVSIMVYVEDVDATFAKALEAGATEQQPLEDKFYGDRSGSFEDPWGHIWHVASHIEDVSPEEMEKRVAAIGGG